MDIYMFGRYWDIGFILAQAGLWILVAIGALTILVASWKFFMKKFKKNSQPNLYKKALDEAENLKRALKGRNSKTRTYEAYIKGLLQSLPELINARQELIDSLKRIEHGEKSVIEIGAEGSQLSKDLQKKIRYQTDLLRKRKSDIETLITDIEVFFALLRTALEFVRFSPDSSLCGDEVVEICKRCEEMSLSPKPKAKLHDLNGDEKSHEQEEWK